LAEQDVFTFLDKVFVNQTRPGYEDPTPSPILKNKHKTRSDDASTSLILSTQVIRKHDEIRQTEKDIYHLEDRIKRNEQSGSLTVAANLKQRLSQKKASYSKLKHVESDLLTKRDQIRAKRTDTIF